MFGHTSKVKTLNVLGHVYISYTSKRTLTYTLTIDSVLPDRILFQFLHVLFSGMNFEFSSERRKQHILTLDFTRSVKSPPVGFQKFHQ